HRVSRGWSVVAIAFFGTALVLGARPALGVLLVPMGQVSDWGRGVPATAIGVNAVASALLVVPSGVLFDRWGPRVLFSVAAVVAGVGFALAALAREPWQLYLTLGLLTGAGFAVLRGQSQNVVVANWFVRRRGLAMGVVFSGMGVGTLVLAPLAQQSTAQG